MNKSTRRWRQHVARKRAGLVSAWVRVNDLRRSREFREAVAAALIEAGLPERADELLELLDVPMVKGHRDED